MKRPCPICGSAGPRRILHRQRFLDGPLGDGYAVVVCGKCGAGFADGIPTQVELDRYYAERSKYEYAPAAGVESSYDFKRFEQIVEQVASHRPARETAILDVGCASGGLLACFARQGYRRLLGSDPSPACAEAARRLHGIEVLPKPIAGLIGTGRRFDLILLVGVLEHLAEVAPAVKALVALLHPDGLLYCAQPDAEAFAECVNAPYQQFSTEHVAFFSATSLNRLMGECGLRPKQIWRWMTEWREGIMDSVVSGIYERTALSTTKEAPPRDESTAYGLMRYLERCARQEEQVRSQIEALAVSAEPILVWGVGSLTRRLLVETQLGRANIVAFVDANRHLQGATLAGRKILAPDDIVGRTESIVISSRAFRSEIIQAIRLRLRLKNRLIELG